MDPFFPSFIAGVETVFAPAGYALVLQVEVGEGAEEGRYRKLAGEGRVDGVFVVDLRVADARIGLLAELDLPAVTLNRPNIPSRFPAVCADDRVGIGEATRHLLELGHTRIAHVCGPMDFLHSVGRRDAWLTALREAGVAPGPVVVSDFTAAGGAAATAQLLDGVDAPTAIVYANDLMAIAGVGVAHGRGLRVPGDLSVTGFDDTEMASHLHPPLTTVTTNPFGWGQVAAGKLLNLIEGTDRSASADIEIEPGHLQVRGSTAKPPRRASEHPPRRRRARQETANRKEK